MFEARWMIKNEGVVCVFTIKRRMRACVVVERQEKLILLKMMMMTTCLGTFENKITKKLHEERTTKMKVCTCIRADLRI